MVRKELSDSNLCYLSLFLSSIFSAGLLFIIIFIVNILGWFIIYYYFCCLYSQLVIIYIINIKLIFYNIDF